MALNAYIRKEKWSQINDLTSTLLGKKKEQTEYKASRGKKIISQYSENKK